LPVQTAVLTSCAHGPGLAQYLTQPWCQCSCAHQRLPMASVTQRAGCQGASSHAVAAAGDHDGAGAAAPVGKSQRLLGGQKLSPVALGLTAA